jgi:hypothetical protein
MLVIFVSPNQRSRCAILLTFFLIWFGIASQSLAGSQPQNSIDYFPGDFLEYWASARLLLDGRNPYSPEQQLALQRSVVSNTKQPLMMWNPPWTLFFILPFGLLSFSISHVLWSISLLLCLLFCSAQLWRIYGGPPDRYWIAWVICFSVVPTYLTLYVKQIDPLVLLGIVGFLHFHQRKQYWLAGAMLPLVAIKPHLVYLFCVALVLWVVQTRQWRILFGGTVAAAVVTLVPLILQPGIFGHYFQLYATDAAPRPFAWKTPTLSTALGVLFGLDNVWVRYVPVLIGSVWLLFYWKKQRTNWNWTEQMPLLLLASQATTLFAWVWDQILLLPALICGAVWAVRGGAWRIITTAVIGLLMINLAPLLVMSGVLTQGGFSLFWMVPLFLLIYVTWTSKLPQNEP